MNELKMQYKADTGNSAYLTRIESKLMIETVDTVVLEDMTDKEIIEFLEYANLYQMTWSIEMNQIHDEYKQGNDLHLINPDYIKWLEDKINKPI